MNVAGTGTGTGTGTQRISKSAEKNVARQARGPYSQAVARAPNITWSSLVNQTSAKNAFETAFGFSPDVFLTEQEIDTTNARDWWERSSAETQCVNIIGKCEYGTPEIPANAKTKYKPKKNGTICYICGLEILASDGTAECEHILPVYKASLFLKLYNTEQYKEIISKVRANEDLDEDEENIYNELKMEYQWAHRCCNQKKNDKDFIKFVENRVGVGGGGGGGSPFTLDYNTTVSILTDIVNGTLNSSDQHCHELSLRNFFRSRGFDTNNWIRDRANILQALGSPVGNIISYLNSSYNPETAKLYVIGSLCNLISAANMDDVWSVWNNLEGNSVLPKQPKVNPVIIIKEATVLSSVSKIASDLSIFDWGPSIARDPVLKKAIYNLYKKAFDIPDNFKENITVNFSPSTNRQVQNMGPAILGSLLHIKEQDISFGNFFINFCAVLTQPVKNAQLQPLFPLTSDENTNKGIQATVAEYVAQSFRVIILARMVQNIISKTADFQETINPQFIQFKGKFEGAFVSEIQKLKEKLQGSTQDASCKFIRMMLNLCVSIQPPVQQMIFATLNQLIGSNFMTTCFSDAAIQAYCDAFTSDENIEYAIIQDFIINSDEKWPVEDIDSDKERRLQNIAQAARTLMSLPVSITGSQMTADDIKLINSFIDNIERGQLLYDLEEYMKEKGLNISKLSTGWQPGTGQQLNTINNLNNVQLKIALETLYLNDRELQQIEENDMREKIMDDARNYFISQETSVLTQTNSFGRPLMMAPENNNQAMTRAETNYNTWFHDWTSRGSPIDEHIGSHGSTTQQLNYSKQFGNGGGGGGGGGQVPYKFSPSANSQYQGNSGFGGGGGGGHSSFAQQLTYPNQPGIGGGGGGHSPFAQQLTYSNQGNAGGGGGGGGGGQVPYNQSPTPASNSQYQGNSRIGGGGGGGVQPIYNQPLASSSSSSSSDNSSMDTSANNNFPGTVFGQDRFGGGSSSKNYTKTKKRYKRHRNTKRKTRHHNKKSKYNRKYKKRRITRRRKTKN